MTLSQIRREVETLKRKYATELEVHRLRPLALEFCDELTEAVVCPKSGPAMSVFEWAQNFFKRLKGLGFRIRGFVPLIDYLERCLDRRVLPQVNDVMRSLLPMAVEKGLIPRSFQEIPFPAKETATPAEA